MCPAVDLASVLTPEVMAPILANPEVQQRLMPYLPSGEALPQSSEELHNTLSSPQFQQVDSIDPHKRIKKILKQIYFCNIKTYKVLLTSQ